MFDIGLSKMALIGVVALVVLGPERLPRVARTAGALLGRAQRYLNEVKAEVTREIELDSLRTMKTDIEKAAHNVENTISGTLSEQQRELNTAWNQQTKSWRDSITIAPEGAVAADGLPDPALRDGIDSGSTPGMSASGGAPGGSAYYHAPLAPAPKRRNWRVRKAAQPLWYKRAVTRRIHVQSGAARVARHQPASLRRPVRFF